MRLWTLFFGSSPPTLEVDRILESSLILKIAIEVQPQKRKMGKQLKKKTIDIEVQHEIKRGKAIAISSTLALTALHQYGKKGADVTLTTSRGRSLDAKVVFYAYEQDYVDIAVVELTTEETFASHVAVSFEPVKLLTKLVVVDLTYGVGGDRFLNPTAMYSHVKSIERSPSALFQAVYNSSDGLSGAGVVVDPNSEIVGIHVASHDSTVSAAERFTEKNDLLDALCTIDSNIHGHSSYNLVCEIARVQALVDFLKDRGI